MNKDNSSLIAPGWEPENYSAAANSDLSRFEKQIFQEKQRRNHVYSALNHYLSQATFYDFFSKDCFDVVVYARLLAIYLGVKKVTSEHILAGYFFGKQPLEKIFKEFELSGKDFIHEVPDPSEAKGPIISRNLSFLWNRCKKFAQYFRSFFLRKSKKINLTEVTDSYELSHLFRGAMKKARKNFKTPVITPELLMITMLDDRKCLANQFLHDIFESDGRFYLFRFKLIKRLYQEENFIKHKLTINELHYAYLLKTQLSGEEFQGVRESSASRFIIRYFRNRLIQKAIEMPLFYILKEEIYRDRFSERRKYGKRIKRKQKKL
ncbi:MAG: hypothetical protein EOP00_00450 [Pedobacter sp.]|nr:MAG: hypothetical protein EOP00_00450 [Pedobacter sp.]